MKVLFLGLWPNESPSNGVDVHFLNLVRCLSKKVNVHVLSFGDEDLRFSFDGAEIRTIERKGIYQALPPLAIWRMLNEIRTIGPDLIHVQGSNPSPYLYSAALSLGYPSVVTVHGLSVQERLADGVIREGGPRHLFAGVIDKTFLRHAGHVIVVDRRKKDLLLKENIRPPSGIECIPNGVDITEFDPDTIAEEDLREARTRYRLGPGRKIICAKSLMANSGQVFLIRSMEAVREIDRGAELLLAGDGPEREGLIKLVRELNLEGCVRFLGNVPHKDMPALLQLSSVAVLPSLKGMGAEEGSSIFLLEAMSMGKPVVATRIGGNVDTVADGQTGLLVPERDVTALAGAIGSLLSDDVLARRLGGSAREFVRRERTWEAVGLRYLRTYQTLIRQSEV